MPGDDAREIDRYCAPGRIVTGEERRSPIGSFAFEAGGVLQDACIGYVTHGTLNAARDNALLLLPGTANSRHSADGYIGAGNAFDPQRHFVVAFEALGSGTSSKPSDGLFEAFPDYCIRDLVRAQHAVVTGALGLARFDVAGASMGAFQALEWSIHFPDMVRSAVLLVPAVRASSIFRLAVQAAGEILQRAPQSRDGSTMAAQPFLAAAARLYFPWTVSDAYLERVPPADLEREIQAAIERSAQWNMWDYLKRYEASARHDVGAPFGGDAARALQRVRARTLAISVSSDRLLDVGLAHARLIGAHVRDAQCVTVESDRGHLGWRAIAGARETREIVQAIRQFFYQETAP